MDFAKIGFVDGKGNSADLQKYFYSDVKAYHTAYYRLQQVDNDGDFHLSQVIRVAFEPGEFMYVYPNPVVDQITVILGDRLEEDYVTMKLISDQGQRLVNENGTMEQTLGSLNQKLGRLTKGTYYLRVETQKRSYTRRIIKL